ncbi:molybdate transport system substrate-binding protein [Georgenia soli]|uniref:Molybdate transport system substrate-binding protein n=1 Tax=Georgenia soli TaxID=638953 RepID=A0A2A9EM76_9MICO|nr:molybdate ABC transporter substrate-binding protein [Georgenia soli]PFG39330.1 molybdate transport system substrate-binding protein [Georgenia soli]
MTGSRSRAAAVRATSALRVAAAMRVTTALRVTTAFLLATSLAACGSAAGPPGPAAGSTGGGGARDGRATELTVFAAASLADVAEQVSAVVEEQDPGVTVSISPAGSSDLVAQILAGAPADVLVTADETTMGRAVEAGAVEEPTVVALNHPVLVVPAGNPAGVTGLDDSLQDAVLVVCAPQVPCGAAAADLAGRAGVTLSPASEELSVTDVLGKVTSGQADAGIVYATDARRAGDAVETVPVAGADQVTNRYPAAVVTGTAAPAAAQAWISTFTGAEGRRILADAGFVLP